MDDERLIDAEIWGFICPSREVCADPLGDRSLARARGLRRNVPGFRQPRPAAVHAVDGRANVVPVHLISRAGPVNAYLGARASVQRAAESFERIVLAIKALGQEMWAYE
ncbi:hypothetical protein ACFMPD_07775 [Sedimentitalea sp. HM32M-2]|uniref:hypothetical protein n=1 Tax=Sedimentitalea sp. HM32M-2 TaxID=3351566 RepID=UPI003630D0E1